MNTTYSRVVAVVPARNEADRITAAIDGLRAQTRVPDRIIVIANNCTDDGATVNRARAAGAWVFDLHDVKGKKAGALNQVLEDILLALKDHDLVLVQDADTVLNPVFVEHAVAAMKRKVGAVGGVFYGEDGGGFLGQLQRMEYQRYAWEIGRNGDKAVVLTGTASLFKVRVLRQIKAARETGLIPDGGTRSYYSLTGLTEDDEITKAVKSLDYRTVSPKQCTVTTEVMTNLRALWDQRLRWQRGALENLRAYGWTKTTAPYFIKQFMMGVGALAFGTYVSFLALQVIFGGGVWFSPFWSSIGLIFVVEKVISVWRAGWRARLVAALLVPELIYDVFQHAVFFRALTDLVRRREEHWVAT